jgi:hypothetical protein
MLANELHLSPRGRGRAAKPVLLEKVRDLTPADLAMLSVERATPPTLISRIRDRHHALARALASGLSDAHACAITGYCPSRISILKADPTFKDLIETYRGASNVIHADFVDRATTLALSAVNALQDRVEDDDRLEAMSEATLLEISKFAADRAGYGPQVKVQQNIQVDLGARLEEAKRRLRAIPAPPDAIPVIEGEFVDVSES